MKKFAHFGAVASEKMEGMFFLESIKVWATDPSKDPNSIEYLFFEDDSPMKDLPVAKGGHPSDICNLQLAHMSCNRQKSDKLTPTREVSTGIELVSNRVLPLTFDWKTL